VTAVFFLFLAHLALGLLATLPFVPDRAGRGFFKFCSASAAFLSTAALWLLLRRYGLDGGRTIGSGIGYQGMAAAGTTSLVATVFFNRAWHFGWERLKAPFLWIALASGIASVLLGAREPRLMVAATDLTSILLLGAATSAMVLGHYYLVVLDLPISALRRLTVLLVVALVLRTIVVATALAGPVHAGYDEVRLVASGLWSPDGVFIWMRLLFGLAGPFSLIWFVWKTVEIRSTQSATGILYVQLFLVLSGELLAKYLRVAAGLPL
jgi:hypothetical protein